MHSRMVVGALWLGLASGCSFQGGVPADRTIACSVTGPGCPAGMTCRSALGYCISNTLAASAPARVYGASITPSAGNASTLFSLDFHVSAPLAGAPAAAATSLADTTGLASGFPFRCAPCTDALTCHCDWSPDPAHLPAEGAVQVTVSVTDAAGNVPAPSPAGTFAFDTTPPGLVAGPTVTIAAPTGVDTPVAEMGNGSTAEICFGVSEPLQSAPTVWAGADAADAGLSFALVPGYPQGLSYCFQASLDASAILSDGPAAAVALATDLAGNTALISLASTTDGGALLVIDRTPPAAPDLSDATGLRYHRAPWGELPTVGSPRLAVVSPGPALSEAGTLIAYADPSEQFELGRVDVAEGAPVDLESLPPDPPEVWVDEVDRAGNRLVGGPVRVQQVDWVLNLGRKIRGDLSANPHDCFARPSAGSTLFEPDDAVAALDAVTGPTGTRAGPTSVVGAVSWRKRAIGMPALQSLAFAYDPSRGQVRDLNQGGLTDSFDGLDWSEAPLPVTPSALSDVSMTFDRTRDRAVLFGGTTQLWGTTDVCDTWELSPSGWQEVAPCGLDPDGGRGRTTLPRPRHGACMAYDTARRRSVLVGGTDPIGKPLIGIWDWDGATWTADWDEIGPPCTGAAMVYAEESDGGQLVIVGDVNNAPAATWVGRWTGQAYHWEQPVPPWPSHVSPEGLAVDPVTGDLVAVVAEAMPNGPSGGALWRWDGASPTGWTRAGSLPSAFLGLGDAFNPAAILPLPMQASGVALQVVMADSLAVGCRLDPFGCVPLHTVEPVALPLLLFGQAAYDDSGNGLFTGGLLPPGGGNLESTAFQVWQWSPEDWSSLSTGALGQAGGGLGYWAPTHEFWAAGGVTLTADPEQGLWAYSSTGGWRRAGSSTLIGVAPALINIPDAGLGGLVATGADGPTMLLTESGSALNATVLNAISPVGAATFDGARGKVVLADLGGPIWEATPPDFSYHLALPDSGSQSSQPVFDDASQTTLLILGSASAGPTAGAVSRWDGETLTPLPVADPDQDGNPIPTSYLGAASDPVSRRIRALAWSPTGTATDTWEMSLADTGPALVCQFRFSAAQAPAGSSVERLHVVATAQSSGPDGGAPTVLALWSREAWRTVSQCGAAACEPLTYEVDDPWAVQTLLDDQQVLGVQVAPAVSNGRGLAEVDVASVEATLTYRLP